jgi:fumarate reductase subunit C
MFILALITATILTLMIIGFGQGIFIKFIFIVIAGIIALISAYDSGSSKSDDEKNNDAMKNGLVILLTLIIMEIGLFFHANTYSKKIEISVVPSTINERVSTGKRDGNGDLIYQVITKKTVEFFDLETNNRLGYRDVDGLSEEKLKLYTSIVGKEYYIDYFPFFTYSEESRYIRK